MRGTRKLFRDLCKKAAVLFRQYWVCFAKLVVAFFIPIWMLDTFFWQNSALIQKIIDTCSLPVFVLIDDAVNFIVLVFFLLFTAAVVKTIYAADHGRKPGLVASCWRALSIFGPYLWVKTLFLFKVLCWSLLFVIPGVIFGMFYNFAGMALLVDNKRGKDALMLSKEIIKPNIAKYLACSSLMLGILYAVYTLFIFYFSILIYFLAPKGNANMALVSDYVEMIFIATAWSFFLVFYYYLYEALKGGKESL